MPAFVVVFSCLSQRCGPFRTGPWFGHSSRSRNRVWRSCMKPRRDGTRWGSCWTWLTMSKDSLQYIHTLAARTKIKVQVRQEVGAPSCKPPKTLFVRLCCEHRTDSMMLKHLDCSLASFKLSLLLIIHQVMIFATSSYIKAGDSFHQLVKSYFWTCSAENACFPHGHLLIVGALPI